MADFLLRLRPEGGTAQMVELYERRFFSSTLDISTTGVVREGEVYAVDLLCRDNLGEIEVELGLNGEDRMPVSAELQHDPIMVGDRAYRAYALSSSAVDWRLFRMSYGFATMEVALRRCVGAPGSDGFELTLVTRDIPCVCRNEDQRDVIAAILEELSHGGDDEVIRWMLAPRADGGERVGLVDGMVEDASRSLRSFLGLVESVLLTYETNLSYFRTHAHCRTMPRTGVVAVCDVRRVGRREISWVSTNADRLHEVPGGRGIDVRGRTYALRELETERPVRSYDNRENRAVLAFIDQVARQLVGVAAEAGEARVRLEGLRDRLRQVDVRDGLLPSLVVVESCLDREGPLLARADSLRRRAARLSRLYRDAIDCPCPGAFRVPPRTKVFQEVKPYSEVHSRMREWHAFGSYGMLREGLLLGTFKMDKLYEYYVLFRLLAGMHDAGFVPDGRVAEPFDSVAYTLSSAYYELEDQVRTRYRLRRGDEVATLYYQPVVYGDEREEGGIDLHRTTARTAFATSGEDAYWTPDYLLVVERDGVRRVSVLDAKFRNPGVVARAGSDGAGGSCFDACMRKYKCAMVRADGSQVDSMWLVCGRATHSSTRVLQGSSWVRAHGELPRDGIVTLAPGADCLAPLLAAVGVGQ